MSHAFLGLARAALRLPEGNPSLPAGSPESVLVWNPGRGYARYRLFWWALALPVHALLLATAAYVALRLTEGESGGLAWNPWLAVGIIAVLVVAERTLQVLAILLEVDMMRYTLTDRALRLRVGMLTLHETTISFANVQNVRFVQGPVQRRYGLGDLVIEVAGGGTLPANAGSARAALRSHEGLLVGVGEPEKLRDIILTRVKVARGAGLGDDRAEASEAGALDSPRTLALLTAIRDGLSATRRALDGKGRT